MTSRPPPCGPPAWSGLSPGTQSAIRLDARAQRCSHTETHDPSWTTAGAWPRQTQLQLRCCLCADDTNTNMTFGSDDTRGSQGDYTTLSWAEARPRQYSGVGAPPARDHIASLTAGGYPSQSPPRVWRRSAGCNGGPHPPACADESFSESRETRRNLTRRQLPGDAAAVSGPIRDFLSVKKKKKVIQFQP